MRDKGEWFLHVTGTCVTHMGGGGSFAELSNKTHHLNFLADCRTAATMKTSRDNRLMIKQLYLFIIFKKATSTDSGGTTRKKRQV